MKKQKQRRMQQRKKNRHWSIDTKRITATRRNIDGSLEDIPVIAFIADGIITIANILASISTPVTSAEPKTEDAEFEIIQPKQLTNDRI